MFRHPFALMAEHDVHALPSIRWLSIFHSYSYAVDVASSRVLTIIDNQHISPDEGIS